MKRSCEDLGLCQARLPACEGCTHATTVYPDPKNSAPARKPALPFCFRARDLAGAMALVVLAFFVAGWLL